MTPEDDAADRIATGWRDAKQKSLMSLADQFSKTTDAMLELWKHMVMVEATVLGLSIGLMSGGSGRPTWSLQVTWVLLLLAIIVGLVLVAITLMTTIDQSVKAQRATYALADIHEKLATGELDPASEKYTALFVAASQMFIPEGAPSPFTAKAAELIERYEGEMPEQLIHELPRLRIVKWLQRHRNWLLLAFYSLSCVSGLALLISIWTPR